MKKAAPEINVEKVNPARPLKKELVDSTRSHCYMLRAIAADTGYTTPESDYANILNNGACSNTFKVRSDDEECSLRLGFSICRLGSSLFAAYEREMADVAKQLAADFRRKNPGLTHHPLSQNSRQATAGLRTMGHPPLSGICCSC
ncbi:MAG: hypothetical protein U1F16_05200 [Turneriella sp.]